MAEPAPGLDRRAVRASFERAATRYDAFAALQDAVRANLAERLDLVRLAPARMLDAGCGTGGAQRLLFGRFPKAALVAVDFAPAMLAAAQRRKPWFKTLHPLAADCTALPLADASIDLVFCNLVLQWLDDPEPAFREFRRVLAPRGLLLFSSFGPDTLHELRTAWGRVDAAPHVNRFLDMHDVGDALVRAGLSEPVLDVEHLTTRYATPRELMRELKGLGAHNAAAARPRGLTGRARLAAVEAGYPRAADGAVAATWEVVYGAAWAPRARDDAAVLAEAGGALAAGGTVGLDALRAELKRRK
jgi:malonyl-CoA O-methyltransferase